MTEEKWSVGVEIPTERKQEVHGTVRVRERSKEEVDVEVDMGETSSRRDKHDSCHDERNKFQGSG
jgi:hypothetical protein